MYALRTNRLVLRRFEDADAARVAELVGNIAVSRWLTRVPHPYSEEDAREFFANGAASEDTLAITYESKLIGCCSLGNELGYWLEPAAWGQGFATEAAKVLLERHFDRTDDDVLSGHLLENSASSRVLKKLGFKPLHIELMPSASLGKDVEVQKMQLTASDSEACI